MLRRSTGNVNKEQVGSGLLLTQSQGSESNYIISFNQKRLMVSSMDFEFA
jgi:hypothetical protein